MNPLPIKIEKYSELARHCKTMRQSRFVLESHKDIIAMKTTLEFMECAGSIFFRVWGKSYAKEELPPPSSEEKCRDGMNSTLELLGKIAKEAPSWGGIACNDLLSLLALCRKVRLQERKMNFYKALHGVATLDLF